MFSGELFEIIDDRMPPNWVIKKDRNGAYQISTRAWLQPGFWEKFFDRDPESVAVFKEEERIIREF